MPRPKLARRFEPRYGVSQAALDVEATYVIREIEDYQSLAAADVDAKCTAAHANCRHSWEHLQLRLESTTDHDLRIIRTLLFRDFYHILELYLASISKRQPVVAAPVASSSRSKSTDQSPFSEWLFEP
jgi:hypothetical protein